MDLPFEPVSKFARLGAGGGMSIMAVACASAAVLRAAVATAGALADVVCHLS